MKLQSTLVKIYNRTFHFPRKAFYFCTSKFKKHIYLDYAKVIIDEESKYTNSVKEIKKQGGIIATRDELLKFKSSDTLFILGSGTSINELSKKHWDQIRKQDSIGFNMFLAHDFIPTFTHIEFTPLMYNYFKKWKKMKPPEFLNNPIITFYRHVESQRSLSDYIFSEKSYFTVPRIPITFRNEKATIRILKQYYFESNYKENDFLIHHRGSLDLVLSIGVLLGYKKIVLLGVDLNNSNYYYEDEGIYTNQLASEARQYLHAMKKILKSRGRWSNVHETNNPNLHPASFNIKEFLQLYNDNVLVPLGIELYIGSEKSALYPYLKVHVWAS